MASTPSTLEVEALATAAGLAPDSREFAEHLDRNHDNLRNLGLRSLFLFPKKAAIRDTAAKFSTHLQSSDTSSSSSRRERDAADRFASYDPDSDCVYMIGNSLGLQPVNTRKLLMEELDVWAQR